MAEGQQKSLLPKDITPRARAGFGFCNLQDKFLLIGGANREEGHYDDFWFLKLENRNNTLTPGWKQVKDFECLDPRTGLTATFISSINTCFIFGGQNFINNQHTDQLYKLEIDKWDCELILTSSAPKPRNSHSAVHDIINKRIVYYGGANEEGVMGDYHFYYYELDKWENKGYVKNMEPREMHTAHMYKGNMLVIGGRTENGTISKDVFSVDQETGDATLLRKLPFGLASAGTLLQDNKEGSENSQYICGGLLGQTFSENIQEVNLETGVIGYMNLSQFECEEKADILMAGRIAMGFGYDEDKDSFVVFGGSKYANEMDDVLLIGRERFGKNKKVLPFN